MPAPYSPLAIANAFIERADRPLDHLTLQKLVYYAQGCALADGLTLTNEQPQVWKLGPVFPSLYSELKYRGAKPLSEPEEEGFFGEPPFPDPDDDEARRIIKEVWKRYRNYTGMQLSDRTHRRGTPWNDLVRQMDGRIPQGTEIPRSTMRAYFREHRTDA